MDLELKTKPEYLESLQWRYATKKFDSSKKLSEDDLNELLESIRLSASSYGLQPYEVLVITDEDIREKLKVAAWNQSQVAEASHLIVFANYAKITEEHVDAYMENISETRNVSRGDLQGLEDMIKSTTLSRPQEDLQVWGSKQTYIALGNLLSAAANMRIDTCPMEGFDNAKFDEILNLKEKNLQSSVIIPVGYRSEDDSYQDLEKVRKSKSDLFHFV
ncbi:MAG: NAD(P)H-dependent oxidoreductase [Christiangramia sp.]|uniref:NAD(P)H-dependent oxidoreductase n=1 Tax=Christiangramia sp. TaxID=1931228 RepID=UPI0032425A38